MYVSGCQGLLPLNNPVVFGGFNWLLCFRSPFVIKQLPMWITAPNNKLTNKQFSEKGDSPQPAKCSQKFRNFNKKQLICWVPFPPPKKKKNSWFTRSQSPRKWMNFGKILCNQTIPTLGVPFEPSLAKDPTLQGVRLDAGNARHAKIPIQATTSQISLALLVLFFPKWPFLVVKQAPSTFITINWFEKVDHSLIGIIKMSLKSP